jgi:hypothetical protein
MRVPDIILEDVKIFRRNFEGREGKYNKAGERNFNLILEQDLAEAMLRDGWNIKFLQPREEGDEPTPFVKIKVSYKINPPKITLITANKQTLIHEDMVEILDKIRIENVDLVIHPYRWEVNGNTGYTGYLQSLYITQQENRLEQKYRRMAEDQPYGDE